MTQIVVRDVAGDMADRSSSKERAMKLQTDLASIIQSRIARRTKRIARWDKEAEEVETLWTGGPAYRKFCEEMARVAREKKAELEAELEQLQEGCRDTCLIG